MELNTELHHQLWCCFSLHKIYVELGDTTAEAGVFGHRHSKNASPLSSILGRVAEPFRLHLQ